MPVLDLFLWNTVLRDWASHEVFAAMLFPRDAAQRNQYLAVNAALWREQHADVPTKIMIEIHCFLPVGGLATLVQSDAAHTIKERAAQAGAEGSIAGDMLLLIWQMFQEGTEKPSVNKAKHVLQHAYKTTVKTGEGLRTAANNAFFSRVWSAYLPVAHLWAAGHLTQHDPAIPSGTPGLGELLDPVLLPSFLARAELFRLFGERYIPHAQRAPLLPPSETWTVPVSFPLPDVTLPTIPLQPNERAALRSYRASTGPSPPSSSSALQCR